jgi:hypothetical protein
MLNDERQAFQGLDRFFRTRTVLRIRFGFSGQERFLGSGSVFQGSERFLGSGLVFQGLERFGFSRIRTGGFSRVFPDKGFFTQIMQVKPYSG